MLRGCGVDPHFLPCALGRPIVSSRWHIELPEIPEYRWRQPNFRLVIHAQDFIHFFDNLCVELFWLEQQYTPEQQEKIIFVCWDHRLHDIWQGRIKVVNFASHSFELVHQLRARYDEWKDVDTKNVRYNWICLNGRAREYRQEVYNLLRHESSGFVSHSVFNPIEIHPYQNYNFNNVDNFVKLKPVYQSAHASIITESLYQDVGGIVTEKTLLAIAARHPFMCIGHRHCHEDVARLGFQNYDDVFDLGYDNETKSTRMYSAIERNRQNLRDLVDVSHLQEKIQANFEWLMGGYADSIRNLAEVQLRKLFEKGF